MAQFKSVMTTTKGQELIAKILAGSDSVTFTRIVTSSQVYTQEQLANLITLAGIKQTAQVSGVAVVDTTSVKIEGAINNADLTGGYFCNTVGVYAYDSDENEILFGVTTVNGQADFIPAFNNAFMSGITFDLTIAIGNAANVTLEVDPAALVTAQQLENVQAQITEIESFIDGEQLEKLTNKGAANGYAGLDANQKLLLSNMPDAIIGQMVHAGEVNAASKAATLTTNGQNTLGTTAATITLTNNTAAITGYAANQGNYYVVTDSGIFGNLTLNVGDWLVANASGWAKVDNTDAVTSVNNQTGVVSITDTNLNATLSDNAQSGSLPATGTLSLRSVLQSIRNSLKYLFSFFTGGILDVDHGGTGESIEPIIMTDLESTTSVPLFAAYPRPGVTGTLGLANGGTGQTTAQSAANALGIGFGSCSTSAATAAKIATCANFVNREGAIVGVRFTNKNTAASMTLNVNSTGAYTVVNPVTGLVAQPSAFAQGVQLFQYSSGNWWLLNPVLTYSNVGAAATSHTHSGSDITSGTLAISRGGTGATTAATARASLGAAAVSHTHTDDDITGLNRAITGGIRQRDNNATDDAYGTDASDFPLAGLYCDYKYNTTDGLSDGGYEHNVLTYAPGQVLGGPATQLALTDNNNIWMRKGNSNSWGPWVKLLKSDTDVAQEEVTFSPASGVSVLANRTRYYPTLHLVVGTVSLVRTSGFTSSAFVFMGALSKPQYSVGAISVANPDNQAIQLSGRMSGGNVYVGSASTTPGSTSVLLSFSYTTT